MRAYVINLPRSVERRQHVQAELARSGITHEFVDAVDGSQLTADERRRLVHPSLEGGPHWLASDGAIGCALSHLHAYRRILAGGDDVAVVLEDDVILPSRFNDAVEELRPHLHANELSLLHFRSFEACRFSLPLAVPLPSGRSLAYPLDRSKPLASAAYVVTREACARMVDAIVPVRVTADNWRHYVEAGAIETFRCVVPAPVGIASRFQTTMTDVRGVTGRVRRLATVAERRRLFPVHQVLAARRRFHHRRWQRVEMADEVPAYLT